MRYYFDMVDHDGVTIDEEGMELPSIESVREEATRSLLDMAREEFRPKDGTTGELAIRVRDGVGPVLQLKFTFEVNRKGH
jgi:hypothetical protein